MLTLAVIGVVAFGVSLLTLFTGFGLGTLLMPVFALFFPLEVAVGATALVHLANNVFKVGLLARQVAPKVLLRFGLPAVLAAFPGAYLLAVLSRRPPLFVWELAGREAQVTPLKLVLGLLILVFAVLDLTPRTRQLRIDPKWLPLGGSFSGFFGGLSGHQGALRAAFLLPLGLTPAVFAATQAVIAAMVDVSRLAVYGAAYLKDRISGLGTEVPWTAVVVATLCAFAGAWVGKKALRKITIGTVRTLAAILLLVVGSGLALGLL
jgi:uncharacterized membrane protein YfcA